MNRCEYCEHFKPRGFDDSSPERTGHCVRYPPVILQNFAIRENAEYVAQKSVFPEVNINWICGEFKEAYKIPNGITFAQLLKGDKK